MVVAFYIAGAVALISTFLVIIERNAVHALLYLIVSLLSAAVIFFIFGSPFAAALEVIVYAGAIMVLFVFVVMMLNLGPPALERERELTPWARPSTWLGPSILTLVLLVELVWVMAHSVREIAGAEVGPKQVGVLLFGPYLLGVEMASMLLLAGLIGAFHLARRDSSVKGVGEEREGET